MKKINLKHSALIVIDVQRYFFERGASAFLEDAPVILPKILKLVEAYREALLPVIFTRHAHKKGVPTGLMGKWWNEKLPWDGSEEAELVKKIVPVKDELVITKTKYSAFEGTALENYLKGRGVSTVVLCGVMTNLCVETTARHAFIKDIAPVIVQDACTAKSPGHHRASILNLAYAFAIIEKTDPLIEKIQDVI